MKKKKGRQGYVKPETDEKRITFLNDNEAKRAKGQGKHSILKIDTPQYQEKVEKVYKMIKEGMRSNEVLTVLAIEDETINEHNFHELLRHAYEFAEHAQHMDREYIFQLHMGRYENMYYKAQQMTDFWGRQLDPKKDFHIMRLKYQQQMMHLNSKEKLIGLHDKSIVLEFNEHKAIVIEQEHPHNLPGYDLGKLNLEEKKELLELIREARTVPIEGIQRVVIKKTVIEINTDTLERQRRIIEQKIDNVETHDITFEEMPKNVVSEFQELLPEPEVKEEEIGPVFIDNTTNKDVPVKQAGDIVEGINKNLLESFRKMIKEKKK